VGSPNKSIAQARQCSS